LTNAEKEAILVAEKLLKLKETLKIRVDSHKGETSPDLPPTRPMEWSDVALLCRGGLNEMAPIFIREFERRSIPIVAPGIPIFDCVEVMDLMNIIQLLDNRQDIPCWVSLLAVIRITKLEIIQLRTSIPR
jgi:ATP-dependent exoDNAse (exonuclease V) beta subunit